MRKYLIGVALAAQFLPSVASASGLDFRITNATGYDIAAVYVDPSSSDSWSGNILDAEKLPDGGYADVTFSGDADSCKWDIKVDWTGDYEPVAWEQLNLCNISEITLKYDHDTDETTAELK